MKISIIPLEVTRRAVINHSDGLNFTARRKKIPEFVLGEIIGQIAHKNGAGCDIVQIIIWFLKILLFPAISVASSPLDIHVSFSDVFPV